MVVLAANRAAILALADAQYPTDEDMRRLQAYINLQYFYCLWGLAPASVTDETSPFNECTHAYLAGVRALFLHLEGMPGDRTAVRALAREIDIEMLQNQASMVLCRFSDEPFNTADVIIPSVGSVFMHPPIAASILALALVALLCGWSLSWLISSLGAGPRPVRAA